MRKKILALLAALTLGFTVPAQASTVVRTYDIAFVQDGFGDASADWFGRLTVLCDGSVRICDGSVRTFSAVVQGVTYDTQASPFPGPIELLDDPAIRPLASLRGYAFAGTPVGGIPTTALQMFPSVGSNVWGLSRCEVDNFCGAGAILGTFTIALAPVPLPAALPLALSGIAALAALRRRRKAA